MKLKLIKKLDAIFNSKQKTYNELQKQYDNESEKYRKEAIAAQQWINIGYRMAIDDIVDIIAKEEE